MLGELFCLGDGDDVIHRNKKSLAHLRNRKKYSASEPSERGEGWFQMMLRGQAGLQLRYYSKHNGKLAKGVKQGGAGAGLCF